MLKLCHRLLKSVNGFVPPLGAGQRPAQRQKTASDSAPTNEGQIALAIFPRQTQRLPPGINCFWKAVELFQQRRQTCLSVGQSILVAFGKREGGTELLFRFVRFSERGQRIPQTKVSCGPRSTLAHGRLILKRRPEFNGSTKSTLAGCSTFIPGKLD